MHELNPSLVILSITGFGHDGPESSRSGYDQILQGEAGLMSLTGSGPDDPQRVGVPIADLLSGMYGAFGLLAALLQRERTGQGQIVRTSLLAALVGVHAFQGTRATVAGEVPEAQGNHHPSIAPYGLFACRDGSVQISIGSEKLWATFAAQFGLDPARSEWATNAHRVRNRDGLKAAITDAFAHFDAAPLLQKLAEAGIPAGKVRSLDEVYQWDQVLSQGLLIDVEHDVLGKISLPGPPLRFFGPADTVETTNTTHSAPPVLNQHGTEIRDWLNRAVEGI
jgi:crotonobetainyl-CoA:carnitine CoA-transferase CaiB-like acyl-CoA transferase